MANTVLSQLPGDLSIFNLTSVERAILDMLKHSTVHAEYALHNQGLHSNYDIISAIMTDL